MPHRHWGIRSTKPPVPAGPTPAAGWSGGAFVSIILVITIVLGIVLYAVSNTVTDVANTTALDLDHERLMRISADAAGGLKNRQLDQPSPS